MAKMRSLDILFAPLLIAGILSSTMAGRGGSGYFSVFGVVNTTFEDIEQFDRELCEKNGGSNAYDEHKKDRQRYKECTDNLEKEVRDEVAEAVPLTRRSSEIYFFGGYCRRTKQFENCLRNLTDSMKTCLDTTKHENAEIFYNVVTSVVGFLCENEGNRISQFMNGEGAVCMYRTSRALTRCGNDTFMEYIRTKVPNRAMIGGLGQFHVLVPDTEKCTVFERFQHCAIDTIKDCEQPTRDLANSLFSLVKKVSTCERILKSEAPPLSVINISLITITAITMSSRFV